MNINTGLTNLFIKSMRFIAYTALATVLLIELIGYFFFDNRYNWDLRYLFFSKNPIVNEFSTTKPFWKYQPNSKIRNIAVYQRLFGFKVEYDCKFDTNKLGFVNTGEISKSADFLILGDSFTEGQGGCPWLTKNAISDDDNLSKFKILNGGLQGTGILQFEQVLDYLISKVDIDNLIIIAISNDFKRDDAFQWPIEGDCYLSGLCDSKIDYWYYVPYDIAYKKILNISNQRSNQRKINLIDRLLRASFSYRTYNDYRIIFKNILNNRSSNNTFDLDAYRKNLEALERMKLRFPGLKIVLVPQRDEVGLLGKKNLDSLVIERYLDRNNYQFTWCNIEASDYMPLDGHPNKSGYKKLFDCLKATIKQ